MSRSTDSVRCRRLGGAAAAGAAVAMLWAAPAAAHVTVHPASLPAGGTDNELVFRVPNERDDATTVKVQVFLPTATPLLGVAVTPVPGWSPSVHTVNLPAPVNTDDGPVSQVVADVTWTATGGGVAPGQYVDLQLAVGALPGRPGQLVLKALQTYSNGDVVRWIEVPTAGVPDPAAPAPVLTLSGRAPAPRAVPGAGTPLWVELSAVAGLVAGLGALAGVLLLRRRLTT